MPLDEVLQNKNRSPQTNSAEVAHSSQIDSQTNSATRSSHSSQIAWINELEQQIDSESSSEDVQPSASPAAAQSLMSQGLERVYVLKQGGTRARLCLLSRAFALEPSP